MSSSRRRGSLLPSPPKLPQLLIRLFVPGGEVCEGILGDLQEEYEVAAERSLRRIAARRYWWSALSLGSGFLTESIRLGLARLRPKRQPGARTTGNRFRGIPAPPRGDSIMKTSLQDLRYAFRTLAQRPAFTSVAVLTLALGIGATTAIFTLVEAIVISPLPFEDQNDLVVFGHTAPALGVGNAAQCAAWHVTYDEEASAFEDIGMFWQTSAAITGDVNPEEVRVMYATGGTYVALRLQSVVGRLPTRADDALDAPALAFLGHAYWQNNYGGDPSVLGQTIQVDGTTREIAGVLPATLRALGQDPAVIMPLPIDQSGLFVGNIGAGSVARLRDGVSLEQAEADLARVMPMAWEKFPGGPVADWDRPADWTAFLTPLKENLVGSVANTLWVLLAGVGVVLLIACANVANLFLVRAEGRTTEMAVRTAIGASRSRIGWEYMKESVALGLLGGLVGLPLAVGGLRVLVSLAPGWLPRIEEISLSPAVFLFALAVSLLTGLFFGVFPVVRHGRRNIVDDLKQGGATSMAGTGRNRVQNALAVSQMAMALVLLVASGLMVRSFQSLQNVDPGFRNPEDILALRINIPASEVPDRDERAATHERIVHRLTEIPGVDSVGLALDVPMDRWRNFNPFFVEGVDPPGGGAAPTRRHNWIGADYFETLQIPLLAGRAFTWNDVHNRFRGAILSESLALEYFGSAQEAIGQRVAARPDPPIWYEVVGVAADVRYDGMGQPPPRIVYWPQVTLAFWQGMEADRTNSWNYMGYAIRSNRVGTPEFFEEVREAVWSVNPNLPLRDVFPLTELMAQSVDQTSFTMLLLATAAAVALILGLVGVYGVVSYAVSQRSREMGMRIALGAEARHVEGMVLRQGLTIFVLGAAIGLGLAYALTRLMTGLLFGVNPVDPVTYAIVPLGLLAVALLASYIPARRAARVDVMEALRRE